MRIVSRQIGMGFLSLIVVGDFGICTSQRGQNNASSREVEGVRKVTLAISKRWRRTETNHAVVLVRLHSTVSSLRHLGLVWEH